MKYAYFSISLLVLLGFTKPRNKPHAHPWTVFFHSPGSISETITTDSIDHIVIPFFSFSNKFKIIYKDHHVQTLKQSSVWGYSDKEGNIYRNANHLNYEVYDKEGDIVIYKTHGKYTHTYFSIGYDGDIFYCNRRNLKKNAPAVQMSKQTLDQYF